MEIKSPINILFSVYVKFIVVSQRHMAKTVGLGMCTNNVMNILVVHVRNMLFWQICIEKIVGAMLWTINLIIILVGMYVKVIYC